MLCKFLQQSHIFVDCDHFREGMHSSQPFDQLRVLVHIEINHLHLSQFTCQTQVRNSRFGPKHKTWLLSLNHPVPLNRTQAFVDQIPRFLDCFLRRRFSCKRSHIGSEEEAASTKSDVVVVPFKVLINLRSDLRVFRVPWIFLAFSCREVAQDSVWLKNVKVTISYCRHFAVWIYPFELFLILLQSSNLNHLYNVGYFVEQTKCKNGATWLAHIIAVYSQRHFIAILNKRLWICKKHSKSFNARS